MNAESSLPNPAPRRKLVSTVLFIAAGALALGLGIFLRHAATGGSAQNGDSLLAVSLPDPAGVEQSLGQWRGKVLVVNFWATWCGPCREEMPHFVEAQKDLGPRGLQFVGIAVDDVAKVKQFTQELGVNYPTLIGGFGAMELSKSYGNKLQALPFTLVLDRKGDIVYTQLGALKPAKLAEVTRPLL